MSCFQGAVPCPTLEQGDVPPTGRDKEGGRSVFPQLQVVVLLTDLWQAEHRTLGLSLPVLSPAPWACAVTSASSHRLTSATIQ